MDAINSLFTLHLIPTLLTILLIDTFGLYGFAHLSLTTTNYSHVFMALFYIIIHFVYKTMVSYIGHSTTHEAESIKISITKAISSISDSLPVNASLFDVLKLVEVRNVKLQTVFFDVNWKIVFGVSCSDFFLNSLSL